jgi:hypothetical protein
MRMASVPVLGYLSFLASNSPIASDFIALADHFGILSEEPFSGCAIGTFKTVLAEVKHRSLGTKQRCDGCVARSFLPNREDVRGIREEDEGDPFCLETKIRGLESVKGIKETVYDAIFTLEESKLARHPVSSHSDTTNIPGVWEWNSGGYELDLEEERSEGYTAAMPQLISEFDAIVSLYLSLCLPPTAEYTSYT